QAMRGISTDTAVDRVPDRHALIPWLLYYPKGATSTSPLAIITPSNPATTVGTSIELSGASSTDEDYTPLDFRWQLSSADAQHATLTPANGVSTQFRSDQAGTYEVMLTVSDGTYSHNEVIYVTVQ